MQCKGATAEKAAEANAEEAPDALAPPASSAPDLQGPPAKQAQETPTVMQRMRAFFLEKLQDGLTVKEVNDLWLKDDDAQHAQTFTVDFMRDGLQFWEKHGRKLQGIPGNKARSTWQQMTWQAKTMWGAKANIHNKIEYACMLGASGDLADLSGKKIGDIPVLSRLSQQRALQSVGIGRSKTIGRKPAGRAPAAGDGPAGSAEERGRQAFPAKGPGAAKGWPSAAPRG